jgi:hypothetical protein
MLMLNRIYQNDGGSDSVFPLNVTVMFRRAVVLSMLVFCSIASAGAASAATRAPEIKANVVVEDACQRAGPKGCLALALEAMGGQSALENLKSLRTISVGHTLLMEQSYRQEPFIASYEHVKNTVNFSTQAIYSELQGTWPEADDAQADFQRTLIAGAGGGVYRTAGKDSPCSLADQAAARYELSLGPERLLLTALHSADLRLDGKEIVRSTEHDVLAFTWEGRPVRIMINSFNHLPDAVDTVEEFHDFWHFWGDVHRRVYLDNWKLRAGIRYPTNIVDERNGTIWRSTQVLSIEPNVALDESMFKIDPAAAEQSAKLKGWESPFTARPGVDLAPGVSLSEGSWNSTIVKQPDGLVILEAPISGTYTQGVIDQARRLNPGFEIKAVLSTSDSWPHVGGVRQCVALGLPVYILDLNRALLDRMVAAPHRITPDLLANSPKTPNWHIVSQKVEIGSGPNRMELYPVRGASTERQYMVYFPEHHLLYASDTLALNQDGGLYDPELMHEVIEAVAREKLQVTTVYAMHQGPTPWGQVVSLVQKALGQ